MHRANYKQNKENTNCESKSETKKKLQRRRHYHDMHKDTHKDTNGKRSGLIKIRHHQIKENKVQERKVTNEVGIKLSIRELLIVGSTKNKK